MIKVWAAKCIRGDVQLVNIHSFRKTSLLHRGESQLPNHRTAHVSSAIWLEAQREGFERRTSSSSKNPSGLYLCGSFAVLQGISMIPSVPLSSLISPDPYISIIFQNCRFVHRCYTNSEP